MKFIKQTTDLDQVLSTALIEALKTHKRVIWLVPGGSNIPISVGASRQISKDLTKNLVIMQTDERFVDRESPDCNWKQLLEKGFQVGEAEVYPILNRSYPSAFAAAENYSDVVEREFEKADMIIGQFGVGADGHIAGIKPNSQSASSTDLVSSFQAEDFERVTLTFPAIGKVDKALVFASGEEKRPVFDKLLSPESFSLAEFPSETLNRLSSATVYNDQIES